MGTITLYDKKTKKLLTKFEISDDVLDLLKKQKDPSQTFEDAIKGGLKKEMEKNNKTTQSGKYCYQKNGKWLCQNCASGYDNRKDAINCCLEKKKTFLSTS